MPKRRYYRCTTCKRPTVLAGTHWVHRYAKDAAPCIKQRIRANDYGGVKAEEYDPSADSEGTDDA